MGHKIWSFCNENTKICWFLPFESWKILQLVKIRSNQSKLTKLLQKLNDTDKRTAMQGEEQRVINIFRNNA